MDIIVYGDEKDNTISDILLNALAKYGGAQLFSTKKLVCNPRNCNHKFLVYDTNKLPTTTNMDGIFLFKNFFKNIDASEISPNFSHIINSENTRAINCLKKTEHIVLTYGVDSKSTLTFSSLTSTEAIVNLQRYVKTKNKILEPHEFSVKLSTQFEPELVLLICAILLFSEISSLGGYEI